MPAKLLVLIAVVISQHAVSQQLRVSPDVLKLLKINVDTIPATVKPDADKAASVLNMAKLNTILLLRETQKQQLLSDNMICVVPDMEAFSKFPAVDPTKKSTYIPEYIPNSIKVDERAPAKQQVK